MRPAWVIRIQGNEVKLSFDGPRSIPIRREEVPPRPKTAIDEPMEKF